MVICIVEGVVGFAVVPCLLLSNNLIRYLSNPVTKEITVKNQVNFNSTQTLTKYLNTLNQCGLV